MRNLLESFIGKEIDVHCGGSSIRGKVLKVQGNVLHVEKDQVICYINIDKIVAVWDSQEKKNSAPGFIVDRSGDR
ncbi:MAG: MM0924 family protein [Acidobacteriota bacterium]